MSRQFRFYLLPSDIEVLIDELRAKVGVKIIQAEASGPETVELMSPTGKGPSRIGSAEAVCVRSYLASPDGADVRMNFIAKQSYWMVHEELSEVIEFSGCDFEGKTLLIGRFYFHTDMLIGDAIWPKRAEFLTWADRIFRTAKKTLYYSEALQAYIGKDADKWRKCGGQFAHFIRANGEPILSSE